MRLAGLALVLVGACLAPAAAQGPPYGPKDTIPAPQREQLAAMLETVRNAQRIEALPVEIVGQGLSSSSRVVEGPVGVNAATGRTLGRVLTSYEWTSWSASACMFDPAVAFRFTRGAKATVVKICFRCGEMVLDGASGRFGEKKMLSVSARNAFLRAAKQAFPKKFDEFRAEEPDVKAKGL